MGIQRTTETSSASNRAGIQADAPGRSRGSVGGPPSAAAMRRESESTAARRSPQVKRRSLPSPPDAGAWITARRSRSRRAARSNACEMQQSSACPSPPAASAIRRATATVFRRASTDFAFWSLIRRKFETFQNIILVRLQKNNIKNMNCFDLRNFLIFPYLFHFSKARVTRGPICHAFLLPYSQWTIRGSLPIVVWFHGQRAIPMLDYPRQGTGATPRTPIACLERLPSVKCKKVLTW